MYTTLAWRNLWRNKRRTLITVASIFFAVILAVVMRSAQLGTYDNMIRNVVELFYGYAQIHQDGYWEEQTINNSFAPSDSLYAKLDDNPAVKNYVPRLESFALASSGQTTKGTMVVGIDAEQEDALTGLSEKVIKGDYLKPAERKTLIATGLADRLNLQIGDTVVLIGQGYHGVSAAGKYPVKGIVEFGSPELNKGVVYLPLKEAQWMYGAEGRLTTIALNVTDPDKVSTVVDELRAGLNPDVYEVMSWRTMMPDLVQAIEADNASGLIIIAILYMVIAFGIFGTLLMMINERQHEFGILVSIGMRKTRLAGVVVLETIMIAILGVIAGSIGSIPVVLYLHLNPIQFTGDLAEAYKAFGLEPIFPFSIDPVIFTSQAAVVLGITIVLALYPLQKIIRMDALEAMRA